MERVLFLRIREEGDKKNKNQSVYPLEEKKCKYYIIMDSTYSYSHESKGNPNKEPQGRRIVQKEAEP